MSSLHGLVAVNLGGSESYRYAFDGVKPFEGYGMFAGRELIFPEKFVTAGCVGGG